MLAYPDPAHFDYAAFLSESSPYQNLSPLPHTLPSSTGATSLSPVSTSKSSHGDSSASSSSGALTRKSQAQKQRLERRGHTKSRRGCYNCKRRRIKVQKLKRLYQAIGYCCSQISISAKKQDRLADTASRPDWSANTPPNPKSPIRYAKSTRFPASVNFLILFKATSSNTAIQLTRYAILPILLNAMLSITSSQARGSLDTRDPMHCTKRMLKIYMMNDLRVFLADKS